MKKTQIAWQAAFICPVVMFVILAWKNPYSGKSIIGNFDPFPDTMYYTVTARNFVLGLGFRLSRLGGEVPQAVPPLYSLLLIPGYLINHDPRTFYFTNLVLGFISLGLLYKICARLTHSALLTGLLLTFYAGTYVIYWQTTLAMAENALLPLVLASIWVWLFPLNRTRVLSASLLAVGCYGAKYVALPITCVYLALLIGRIFVTETKSRFLKLFSIMLVVTVVGMTLMNGKQIMTLASLLLHRAHQDTAAQATTAWLTISHLGPNFSPYAGALIGKPIYNLWSTRPILPPYLALIVLLWCLYAAIRLPRYRSLAVLVLGLTFGQLAFLTQISMIEGRYAFVFLPLVYTGLAALLGSLKLNRQVEVLVVTAGLLFLGLSSYKDWKLQLLLNFKGSEVPWWQVGIAKTDGWINQLPQTTTPVTVITSMDPFMWDFYRTGNYRVLPFDEHQDFTQYPIWGVNPLPANWQTFYRNQKKQGREIYLSTVGFNQKQWAELAAWQQQFPMILINQDCASSCRLYHLN